MVRVGVQTPVIASTSFREELVEPLSGCGCIALTMDILLQAEQLPGMISQIRAQLSEGSDRKVLIAQAPGCEAVAAALAVGCLMASQGLSLYQALVRASQCHCTLQVRDECLLFGCPPFPSPLFPRSISLLPCFPCVLPHLSLPPISLPSYRFDSFSVGYARLGVCGHVCCSERDTCLL